jgi:hypothetical protein
MPDLIRHPDFRAAAPVHEEFVIPASPCRGAAAGRTAGGRHSAAQFGDLTMTLRILAPLAVLSLVAMPAMAATGKAPAAKHHHVMKKKSAKTTKTTKTAPASDSKGS